MNSCPGCSSQPGASRRPGQVERELRKPIGAGSEALFDDYLAERPVVWGGEVWRNVGPVRRVGHVGRGRVPGLRHGLPVHLLWGLQLVNLHASLSYLGLAVERLRLQIGRAPVLTPVT